MRAHSDRAARRHRRLAASPRMRIGVIGGRLRIVAAGSVAVFGATAWLGVLVARGDDA